MEQRITFASIPVGEMFEFYGPVDFPYSGFEPGPWEKTGRRTYRKARDRSFTCEVGTTCVEVYLFGTEPIRRGAAGA